MQKSVILVYIIFLISILIPVISYFISPLLIFPGLFIMVILWMIMIPFFFALRRNLKFGGKGVEGGKISSAKAEKLVEKIREPFLNLEYKVGFLRDNLKEKELNKIGRSFQSYSNGEIELDDFLSFSLKMIGTKFSKIF